MRLATFACTGEDLSEHRGLLMQAEAGRQEASRPRAEPFSWSRGEHAMQEET